jgi:uncharacterized short protein YbdD (DUF466 family)
MTKTIPNTPCPAYLQDTLRRLTPLGGRVLDVASGLACYHPHITERCRELVCVDAFQMYLDHAKKEYPDQVRQTYLGKAQDVLPTLEDDAYDFAIAIDFLEHMEKPESAFVVEQMKRLAPLVAVCVPRGNHPQDHDWLGNGADEWQMHRSQWDVGDLEALGFEEELWEGFHNWALQRYAGVPGFVPDALWGVWRLS